MDLSNVPIALLKKILRPNMVGDKPISDLHLGEIDNDQCAVAVVTGGLESQSGLLSSVYSTLQVAGSLHDVQLITLDKPLREYHPKYRVEKVWG